MKDKERAVIAAARQCFSRNIDALTSEVWLDSAICDWQIAALADAVRQLDGYPPYGRVFVSPPDAEATT